MQEQIRQRLIGAIVLIMVAAFTWPLLFDDFDPQTMDHRSQVPEMPRFETFEVANKTSPTGVSKSSVSGVVVSKSVVSKPVVSEPVVSQSVVSESAVSEAQSSNSLSSSGAIDISSETQSEVAPLLGNKLDEQGVPMTWVVQVGSFTDEENAKKLLERLISKDHQAYMRTNNAGPKTVYRLYIGPLLEKRKAIQVNTQIKKQFNLNGLVVRYKIHDK